jgi:hypothetical protein
MLNTSARGAAKVRETVISRVATGLGVDLAVAVMSFLLFG